MEFTIFSVIVALILGALASICIIVSAFSLSRKIILWSMLLTNVLTGAQFILLNQTATTYLIGISLTYSVLLMLEGKIKAVRTYGFTAAVLALQTVGYFVINGMTWNWGLLALLGTIVGAFAMWLQNPIHLKVTMLLMGFIWLAFQLSAGAYGQLPGEVIFIAGVIFSLVTLSKAKTNGIPLTEVEELPALMRRKLASSQKVARTAELAFN